MIGWILLGLLAGAAVISIVVSFLDRDTVKETFKENNINHGTIKDIVHDGSVTHIKLDAIKEDGSEVKLDYEVEDYNQSQIREGVVIYS